MMFLDYLDECEKGKFCYCELKDCDDEDTSNYQSAGVLQVCDFT